MQLILHNTLTRKDEVFVPINEGEAKLYTCGPTVYNYAHIGNFRAYIFEDLLRRTLQYAGYKVIQVMNLTDVDDKTIKGSREAKVSLNEYTQKYKQAFFEDIQTLRIQKAEYYPAATEHIPEMINIISKLIDKGYAYKADDGSIYFSVAKFANYGKLSKIDMANQTPGKRVKLDEYSKDNLADFALWKAWDEYDDDVFWDSPWGKGRPGWHIECSAMSMKYLGPHFDIHTGGIDNMFPHHEDEIAQSEAANDCKFVNYWLHCEHLLVNGQKMSKSLNNFYTLRDLLAKNYTGRQIRMLLLSTHYRKKLNFTLDTLDKTANILHSFDDFFRRINAVRKKSVSGESLEKIITQARENFAKAICNDLNVSEANAALYMLIRESNKLLDAGKLSSDDAEKVLNAFRDFDKVFAVFDVDEALKIDIPTQILSLVEQRQKARNEKKFAEADTIRAKIAELGYIIEDTPYGPRIIPKNPE